MMAKAKAMASTSQSSLDSAGGSAKGKEASLQPPLEKKTSPRGSRGGNDASEAPPLLYPSTPQGNRKASTSSLLSSSSPIVSSSTPVPKASISSLGSSGLTSPSKPLSTLLSGVEEEKGKRGSDGATMGEKAENSGFTAEDLEELARREAKEVADEKKRRDEARKEREMARLSAEEEKERRFEEELKRRREARMTAESEEDGGSLFPLDEWDEGLNDEGDQKEGDSTRDYANERLSKGSSPMPHDYQSVSSSDSRLQMPQLDGGVQGDHDADVTGGDHVSHHRCLLENFTKVIGSVYSDLIFFFDFYRK